MGYLTEIDPLSLHVTYAKSEAEVLDIGKAAGVEDTADKSSAWRQSEWDFEGGTGKND